MHIGATLLGHLNIQTTRGYVAMCDDDVFRHYLAHLNARRRLRPDDEYRDATSAEWDEFENTSTSAGRTRRMRTSLRHPLPARTRRHPMPHAVAIARSCSPHSPLPLSATERSSSQA
ncbi:hypothetical protein [Streptomyces hawaiiensis]|uniref:hypothetical protein n=1 Tax=Streptomyces hawaiiensis TaxID=67305 RepID=UPI001FE86F9D|nr:hypothetical protein [Streptomyces hawaiiensis]